MWFIISASILSTILAGFAFAMASPGPSRDLVARQVDGVTSNQLVDGSPCRAVTVIFARGTTDPGNLGELGEVFVNNLTTAVGDGNLVAVQGVNCRCPMPRPTENSQTLTLGSETR